MKRFPLYTQHDAMDCGPTCLRMITAFYRKNYPQAYLREQCFITNEGVSMLGISEAAEKIGIHTIGVQTDMERLNNDIPLPCILHWNQNHFVVLYKIRKTKRDTFFYIADPTGSKIKYNKEEFMIFWELYTLLHSGTII